MNAVVTEIPDVVVLEPTVFKDDRGYFFESFNKQTFLNEVGVQVDFVQDNQAYSVKNVLRGLHYQLHQAQGKLVRVIRGEIYDIAVDIRKSSSTFGQWVGVDLSEDNHRQLWVPKGFAHGYVVRSASAEVVYKTTDFYAPEHERCILWNDVTLAIDWSIDGVPIVSSKDKEGISFKDAEVFP